MTLPPHDPADSWDAHCRRHERCSCRSGPGGGCPCCLMRDLLLDIRERAKRHAPALLPLIDVLEKRLDTEAA